MACSKNTTKPAKNGRKLTANERYLNDIFAILRKRDAVALADKNNQFNDTELRLIGEILAAKSEGRRLISTQLATLLGITRSAISQIVNRLESKGIVRRVDDEIDRKIAYIEVTEEVLSQYQTEIRLCANFAGRVVKRYGAEKFDTLCNLFNEFLNTIEEEQQELKKKKSK